MATRAAHAVGATDVPLLEETIGANLKRTVAAHGGRAALVVRLQGLRYSYDELNAAVDELARGLVAAGIERGDRLGIWSPNCAEWGPRPIRDGEARHDPRDGQPRPNGRSSSARVIGRR